MHKTKKRFLSALMACAMLVSIFPFAAFAGDDATATGKIYYVDAAYSDGQSDGTKANPYTTIQAAINAAAEGDTIKVAPGEYDVYVDRTNADLNCVVDAGLYAYAVEHNLLVWKGVTIEAENPNQKPVLYTECPGNGNGTSQQTVLVTASNATLKNLDIKVTTDNPNKAVEVIDWNTEDENVVNNTTIDNCNITGSVYVGSKGVGAYTVTNNSISGILSIANGAGNAMTEDEKAVISGNTINGYVMITGTRETGWDLNSINNLPEMTKNTISGEEYKADGIVHNMIVLYSDKDTKNLPDAEAIQEFIKGNDPDSGWSMISFENGTGDDTSSYKTNCVGVVCDSAIVTDVDGSTQTYASLEDAVSAAQPGATIDLNSDVTLTDGLNINKDITIDGHGHTITTTGIDTQISAVNGEATPYSAIIAATNDANVVLKNLVVKGDPAMASADTDLTHNTRYIGVTAIDADLTMENCKIEDITYEDHLQGMQNGFAIYAVADDNTKTLKLINTEIANFNKTAVIARDNIDLNVDGCTITGFGEQAIIGQNGIQYAGNATIKNTKISGLIYNADNEWKNCSTAIYNVAGEDSTTNSVLDNVVCEGVDSSYYATGGTTTISGGSYVHVGSANASVAGSEDAAITITGGTFDSDVSDYLAPGLELDSDGNVYHPYTGKYSYEITVADTDNGTVSVDKYATEGEDVTITVTPDKGYKLDELTVTAGSKDVDVKDNGNGIYTFTMPSSKVKVAATFVEDENYDDSITISMTVGSNDFVINDTIVTIPDAAPYIANSRTYVPFRALGEAIGADVVWDNDARTVTYTLDGNEIVMTIGSTTYTVNGVEKTMDVAPEITGERTYVPIRFIGEALGFKVTPLYAEDGTTASVAFEK